MRRDGSVSGLATMSGCIIRIKSRICSALSEKNALTDTRPIQGAAVVGSGVMGSGIAIALASNGIRVSLNDLTEELLMKSRAQLEGTLMGLEGSGLVEDTRAVLKNITFEPSLDRAAANGEIVFEAISEDLEAKKALFKQLAEITRGEAVLTSNTSVIQIGEIATGIHWKEKIMGVHWMNPPYVAPLVEVIPSKWTNPGDLRAVELFLKDRIRKEVVRSPDKPGFLVNRFNAVLASEAIRLKDEGVSIDDIDRVWKYHLGLLYTMFGPLGNLDYIGLDIAYMASLYLSEKLDGKAADVPGWFLEKLEKEELGVKTGKGFYDYGGRDPGDMYSERARKLGMILRCLEPQR